VEIHQILVGAAYGDAITNEALALRTLLRGAVPSEIYAYHRDGRVPGVRPLSEYRRLPSARQGGNLLIFHSSIGEPRVAEFLSSRAERLIVRYHNITPAAMFEAVDPVFASFLEGGRRELMSLKDHAILALADSRFNQLELMAAGYADTVVVPLVLDYPALVGAPVVPPRAVPLPGPDGGPVVTFVGRVSPNKNHPDLLAAFHVLKTYRRWDAHLYLAGRAHSGDYRATLDRYVQALGLIDVHLTGSVSESDLVALYRRSDVFLCLSRHEGFCVPLVEAMGFGVPIVAWGETAVGETLDGAGVVLDSPDPVLAAEAVAAVLEDGGLRADLVARGRRRFEDFAPQRTGAAFLEAVLSVA
jgi:glycosyltransferase involved in cell wall biosynthesis